MIQSVYLGADATLTCDLSTERVAEIVASKQGVLWLDLLQDQDPEPVDWLLRDVFAFHPLAIEDALNSRIESPKVDDYQGYLFIVFQSVGYQSQSEHLVLHEVDLFLGPNYVVTVHRGELPEIAELFSRCRDSAHPLSRGADFLAHTILDRMVDLMIPAVEELDERIDELEQMVLDRPDKELLPQVLLVKRNTLRLRRSILPQRDLVNRLSRGEFGQLVGSDALVFFRDVYDHIVRVDEMLEGVRDLADGALNSYLSAINNRMNEVMKALSVVAVIFLPLTLIASIFGTNLDYTPFGGGLHGGFYWMLGLMAAITAMMVLFFRHRGWF